MRATTLTVGALALGLASAWTYPDCEPDNCYRELTDARFIDEAKAFCPKFLAGTTTAPSAIPTNFENCEGDVKRVSSACSCITYVPSTSSSSVPTSTPSSTPSSSSSYPTSTPSSKSSSLPHSSSSSYPTSSHHSKTTKMTTSTIYTTKVYTVTSCSASVTNCPGGPHLTTETVILSTTVCPVTEEETETPTYKPTPTPETKTTVTTKATSSYGTITAPTKTQPPLVTAAAGRVVGGVGAAVVGLVAAVVL